MTLFMALMALVVAVGSFFISSSDGAIMAIVFAIVSVTYAIKDLEK